MSDQLSELRLRALLNTFLAILVIYLAFQVFGSQACFVLAIITAVGLYFASRNLVRLIRMSQSQQGQFQELHEALHRQFARSTLPRQVFMLLLAVAEADGPSGAREREVVRQFVLERFTNPIDYEDLRTWEATRIAPEQIGSLAINLRRILTDSECETIFSWCCLVAFADDSFHPEEHMALQEIARCLQIDSYQARTLFQHAKRMHMGGGDQRRQGGSQARGRVNERGQALAVLGLEEGADEEQIRARHRELVKKYHPDRHVHLGPVAAKEAEERFREVQAAYEVLV